MRQGSASRDGMSGGKVEPVAHRVSPTAVSQIGMSLGNHATDSTKILSANVVSKPLYSGKGFEAPHDVGRTIHHGGSQGRS